jgi:hypothetical protein
MNRHSLFILKREGDTPGGPGKPGEPVLAITFGMTGMPRFSRVLSNLVAPLKALSRSTSFQTSDKFYRITPGKNVVPPSSSICWPELLDL